MERFFKFYNDKYILNPPKAVVKEADEYLKYSDDFYGWWSDKYVPCKGRIISSDYERDQFWNGNQESKSDEDA